MVKPTQEPDTYDAMFAEGGSGGVFDLPYQHSGYYPLFKLVAKILHRNGSRQVLEVGCGTGGMAHLLLERGGIKYQGFDFSPVAVGKARARTGEFDLFSIGDATLENSYEGRAYDSIICTEVLEHIEADRQTIGRWRSGTFVVCSVPNYDSQTHVRFFKTETDVKERYGDLIEIHELRRLRKPFLSDLSLGSWMRAVRWNRYRPERLKWLMGLTDFERDGGWFVFSGVRR